MRATPILVAAFLAAGSTVALAQSGGGAAGGGAAGGASSGGAAADGGGGATGGAAGTGAAGGTSAGGTGQSATGVGGDQRTSRSFGRFRRGDDMAPLVVPREEAPVRLRTDRERW